MTSHPQFIYKIITAPLWEEAQETGVVPGMPIDIADGYMHFSTAEQLRETLSLHFRGQGDLTILRVETAPLGEVLKWEPSRGGALFPHLYAQLTTAQIDRSFSAAVDAEGVPDLPDGL